MNTDMLDHLVTGGLALGCIAGAIVIQLHSGETPDWLVTIAGAAAGFYFRGRANGQWNKSLMSQLEEKIKVRPSASQPESGTQEQERR